MYYYATRTDKNGHRLMTSYSNTASQKKYGGAEAKLFNGVVGLRYQTGEFENLEDPREFDVDKHALVRSRMHNPKPGDASGGKFVIKSLEDGEWKDTPFRTSSYGDANSIMKAVIGVYSDLIIVEEGQAEYVELGSDLF